MVDAGGKEPDDDRGRASVAGAVINQPPRMHAKGRR